MKSLMLSLILMALFSVASETQAQIAGYSVSVSPTNVVVGEEFVVQWSVPFGTFTIDDWLGVFILTAPNDQYVTSSKSAGFRGGNTVFDAPENVGLYNVRYFEIFETDFFRSHLAATSETLVVRPPLEASTRFPVVTSTGPIIAFGDSLVAGKGATGGDFPSWLSRGLGKAIINKGVIGLTTDDALSRLNADILPFHPRITIVLLGGNDVIQGKDLARTITNLRTITRRLYESGSMVILVGVQGGLFTDRLRDGFHSLWVEERPAFVPNILRGIIGNLFLLSDAVHPNDEGYYLMAERILPTLRQIDAKQTPILLSITRREAKLRLSWNEPNGQRNLVSASNLGIAFLPVTNTVARSTNSIAFVELPLSSLVERGYFKLQ